MYRLLILIFILTGFSGYAQKLNKEDKTLMANLQTHVVFLSDDKLQGRRAGTIGEKLAAEYISGHFHRMGLKPLGTKDFFQSFTINDGRQVNESSFLIINENHLSINKDYFPLAFSANSSLEAVPSLALSEPQMPWFWDLKELLEENKSNPHFDLSEAVMKKVGDMQNRGATAVFIYNSSSLTDNLSFDGKAKVAPLPIPVIYLTKDAVSKFLSDNEAILDIKLKIDIGPKTREANNVIGYIDNGAKTTVVIGAHFDHLGFGEDGNSMIRDGSKQVHNGADDNSSGTAALIELARLLKGSKNKNNNYLLIAFSGEELGLFGSKYFVENPTIDLSKVSFMINMDMIGRLNDSSRTVTVGGYGTTPKWGELYGLTGKKRIYAGNLLFKFDSSGTGPSDHTSFYRKDIPVLFYFTGLHTDYHKPTDDHDKINYMGQLQIVKHIHNLVETVGKTNEKLAFTKTREAQTTTSARFSVSLGIMPDYTFSGQGVRVDGVSENKPAKKAGMQAGDIIVLLGDYPVSSVESYMQALSKFKKGDKTTVSFNRGNEKLSVAIEF